MPIDFIEDEAQAPAIAFEPDVTEEAQPQAPAQPQAEPELKKSAIPEFLLPRRRLPTLTPEQIAAQEKPLLDLPMWAYRSLPLAGVAPNVAEGLARATKANIEGLTSPAGIATTAAAVAAPAIAGPAIAAQMLPGIYQSGKEAVGALKSGDIAKLTESLVNLGVGGAMTVAGGAAPFLRRAPVGEARTLEYPKTEGERIADASRQQEAGTVHENVPIQPRESAGQVPIEESRQGIQPHEKEAQGQPNVRVAEPSSQETEIPLGLHRPSTPDPSLALLSPEEFDRISKDVISETERMETLFDERSLSRQETQQLATIQDKFSAVELEKYRREFKDQTNADLFHEALNLTDSLDPSDGLKKLTGAPAFEKLRILLAILKTRTATHGGLIEDWFAKFLSGSPDAREVYGARYQNLKKLSSLLEENQPKPEPQWFNHPLSFWRKYTRPVTASKMPEDVRAALLKFTKIEDKPKVIADFLKARIKEVEEQAQNQIWKQPLYHGSATLDLTKLTPTKVGDFGKGVYITNDPKFAQHFADSTAFGNLSAEERAARGAGKVYLVELSHEPKNPWIADDTPLTKAEKDWWNKETEDGLEEEVETRADLAEAKGGHNYGPWEATELHFTSKDWDAFAKAFDHDLLVIRNEMVAKDPDLVSVQSKAPKPAAEPPPVKPSEEAELRQDLAAEMGEEPTPETLAISSLEDIPENTQPIPELSRFEYHPSEFQRGLPVYTHPNARAELAQRFGIPTQVGGTPGKPTLVLFVNEKGRPIALWRPKSKPAPPPAEQAPQTAAPTEATVSPAKPAGVTAPEAPQAISQPTTEAKSVQTETPSLQANPQISVGPGAAAAGEPGKYSAIEQLSDQLRTVPSNAKADPLPWRERMADKLTAGKTALAKVVGKMRAVTESVKDAASGMRDINDLERTVGVLDKDLQSSELKAQELRAVMPRQYKSGNMRRAAALFIDAGGDVQQFRDALPNLPENTPSEIRHAIETVAKLPDDARPMIDFLRQFYGVREGEAIAHGVLQEGLPDYFTHIWKTLANMPSKLRTALTTGNINTFWQFRQQRKISTFLEGIMEGKVPELDPAKVIPYYNYTLDRAIASRAFIRRLSDLKMSDGRELLAPDGTATKVGRGSESEATLIKPRAYQGDYRSIDHPALRKWKWAAKDENGNPVFYQADLRVHPEAYERIARMMERSRLTATPKMKAALRVGSELKAAKFGLASMFHQIHVGLHAAFHWTDPLMLSKKPWVNPDGTISASHPFVQDAIQYGHLKLAAEPWEILNMSEGILGHGSLIQKIPLVGPWSRVYSEWLFSRYIPKLKLATYENALPRNLKAYEGKYTPEQIKARTGDAVNNAFGELNRLFLGKYGRDPQFQRQLRLMFLAPDFGEARLRFAAKALTKGGHEERLALATMFVTLYTAARVGNYLASGDPRWTDWNHLFAVKTKNRFFSLRSVLGDLDHAYDDFRNFAVVRLSPFTRTLQEVIWGKDERGRKRTGSEIVQDVMRQAVPISLQGLAAPDRKFLDDFATSMGVSTRRDNPEMDIHQLARDWQKSSKDPKVQAQYQRAIHETPLPSDYARLRQFLRENNREAAQKEFRKLRTIKTRAQIMQALQPAKPVTGSWPNERLFVQSLTQRQRETYRRAMEERRQVYQRALGLGL